MSADATYVPRDEPMRLGDGLYLFGMYRVRFDDGWTYVHPHQAHSGTLGVEPVDLEANPEYRAYLIERGEATR